MRGIPLIIHLSALSAGLPLLAWLARRLPLRGHEWVLLASALSLSLDALGLYLATQGRNNHWLAYLLGPLLFAAMLMALAERQRTPTARSTFRIVVVLDLLACLILSLWAEDLRNYSQFAMPLGALLVLGASTWTLVQGGFGPGGRAGAEPDWHWVPLGFALYSAVTAAYFPFVAVFMRSEPALVGRVMELKAVLVMLAFALVAWGVWCRTSGPNSGRSSSSSS